MSPSPALPLDRCIAAGPDGEAARVRLERLRETGVALPSDGAGVALLAAILASGTFLPDLILGRPERLAGLLRDPWKQQAKPRAVVVREIEAACADVRSFAELQRALRDYAHGEMLRLGTRELGVGLGAPADAAASQSNWPLPEHGLTLEVARELSALADACLERATRFCEAELRARYGVPVCHDGAAGFSVIAMGKLGGEELNFSSDIDIIYIYASDNGQTDGQAASLGLHDYYTRLCQAITRAIAENTNEGFVFRVDLRLRPEGSAGALCNSLAAAESYYETFGRTWERQALLRARPAAGDGWLGDRFLATVEPFVFPRTSSEKTLDEVRTLRRMFVATTAEASWNVKLGSGGIRDVELVAQLLQLLYAGKRRDLRERTTLPALHKLGLAGLLSDHEVRTLSDTYRLWRRIEHRLQLEHGQQTHSLPTEEGGMACLAQRLGYAGADQLVARIAEGRAAVRAIADTLGDPVGGPPPRVLRMLAPTTARGEVEDDLRAAGFRDVAQAADNLETARARLPAAWLEEAIASPDPDRALAHFRDLALRASFGLFTLLRDDRQLLRLLAGLFGISERLSRHLVSHTEIWPSLTQELGVARPREDTWRAAFAARLVGCDDEGALRRLRLFHGEEILRIGLHDVAGDLAHDEVSAQLGRLAEACLQEAMQRVANTLAMRFGRPEAELTILVFGSCGAHEMRYGSDLELVFLFDRNGTTSAGMDHQEWFGRLAQRLIGALGALLEEGRLYSVDTRLRPSGSQGLLVTTYSAFEEYHREQAAPWERMALLRARPACVLAAPAQAAPSDFAQRLAAITYGHEFPEAVLRSELARMRRRIETERAGRGPLHLRFSPGGLTDLEFMAAWEQLRHGATEPALRTTSPLQALAHLAAVGLLDAQVLDDYHFLARTILRLRLLRDDQDDRLRPDDESPLARSLGFGRPQLKGQLATRMARTRGAFSQLLA